MWNRAFSSVDARGDAYDGPLVSGPAKGPVSHREPECPYGGKGIQDAGRPLRVGRRAGGPGAA